MYKGVKYHVSYSKLKQYIDIGYIDGYIEIEAKHVIYCTHMSYVSCGHCHWEV